MTKATAKLFDDWALSGRGDKMAEGHWPRVKHFFDDLNLTNGLTCLDVGCGNGYLVRKMADTVAPEGKAIGVDISAEMVELAQGHSLEQPNAAFKVSPAEALELEDISIDRIVSVEMLYYADSPEAVLKDWYRVTKSGGSIWVMVDYYKENQYSECWGDLLEVPVHFYSEDEYKQLFGAVGFTEVTTRRLMDERPIDAGNFTAGWGYNTIEDLQDFRENVGSLLITGKKA